MWSISAKCLLMSTHSLHVCGEIGKYLSAYWYPYYLELWTFKCVLNIPFPPPSPPPPPPNLIRKKKLCYLCTCAPSNGSDKPAHLCSLIRIFTGGVLDNQVYAQADLSFCWAHLSNGMFSHISVHFTFSFIYSGITEAILEEEMKRKKKGDSISISQQPNTCQ